MQYPAYLAGRDCEACGSPALVPCDATGAPVHPSAVLPFRLTQTDARSRFDEWVKGQAVAGIRPRSFAVDAVRAVYVPCWAFSARVRCPWRGELQRTDREGETTQVPVGGVVDAAFDDVLVPASRSVPPELMRSLEPFPVSDVAQYDTCYLAGHQVELYAVNLWDAWDTASARMGQELDRRLRADSGISVSLLETWPEWSGERCHHLLVPVYLFDYRYGSDSYLAVVNGCSGVIDGRAPHNAVVTVVAGAVVLAFAAGLVYGIVRIVQWL